jgi:TetR/AcrR family transcriptional regulator
MKQDLMERSDLTEVTGKVVVAEKTRAVRADQRDQTRQLVLDAAIDFFSRRGFEGASLSGIAKQSGVPVPLIVYHFKSKEQLWRESVDMIYERVENHIASYNDAVSKVSGRERYRLATRATITAMAKHPEYMRMFVQEGTQKSDRLKWMVDNHQSKITDRIVDLVMDAQAEGLLPQMDPMHAKFILSGAFSLAVILGPEVELVMGVDSHSDEFIEKHIDLCMLIMLPK